jgi:hypothetical protein
MFVLGASSPPLSVMCAGRIDCAKVIVSVPEPAVQLEARGVVSLLAESIACRRVQSLEVAAGSAAELTTIEAALAPAAEISEAPIAPIVAAVMTRFLASRIRLILIPLSRSLRLAHPYAGTEDSGYRPGQDE